MNTEDLLLIAHKRGVRTAKAHRPQYSGNPAQLAVDLYPLDVKEREFFLAGYLGEKRRLEAQ